MGNQKKTSTATTVGDLEKALGLLGAKVGVDVDENILSKAMADDEIEGSEAGAADEEMPPETEKKTPPPAKKTPPKKEEKKEEKKKEDEDKEPDDDEDDEDGEEGEDGTEEGEDPEEEGAESDEEGEGEKALSSNLMKSFLGNENIEKAVDVSDYLEALTVQNVDAIDSVRSVLRKSLKEDRQFRRAEFEVLKGVALLSKSLHDQVVVLRKQVAEMSGQPVMRKSLSGTVAPKPRTIAAPVVGEGRQDGVLAKSLDGGKTFSSVQAISDDIFTRMQGLDPTDALSKSLSVALTQLDTNSADPNLFRTLGYDIN